MQHNVITITYATIIMWDVLQICYLSSFQAKVASRRVPNLDPRQLSFLYFTEVKKLRDEKYRLMLVFWVKYTKDTQVYFLQVNLIS